ncbi:MAG: hypothetical protein Q9213_001642 [Squamulea squamosa]
MGTSPRTPYSPRNQADPESTSYVLLTAYLSTVIGYWHIPRTGRYRRAAKVPYPNAYATAAEAKESKEKYLFNCAQRSHVTFLEHQPQFLTTLLISGLKFPYFSSAMGIMWCVGRVANAVGYTDPTKEKGDGRNSTMGRLYYLGGIGLLGGALLSAIGITGLADPVMEMLK